MDKVHDVMMMACVLVLSLRCIDVYGHGCELGCGEVVGVVSFSAFLDESFAAAINSLMAFWCLSAKNWESTI